MTLNKSYIVKQTSPFENELELIYRYLAFKLKEPNTAKRFYRNVISKLNSLQYFPERYTKISNFENKSRNLRKLLIDNYLIIYEVLNDARRSYYITYFSFNSKLF